MGVEAGEQEPAATGKHEQQHTRQQAHIPAPPVVDTNEDGLLSKLDVKTKEGQKGGWNTSHLTSRLGVDAMCAAAAGGLVAPLITIVDK